MVKYFRSHFYGSILKPRHRHLELRYLTRAGFAPTVVVNMNYVASASTFHSEVMLTVVRP